MRQNKYHSYNNKKLCNGCKLCVKGRKSVIYITGICPRKCYYCPLSDNRKNKDVMFANERKIYSLGEMIEEVRVSASTGAGITGGDPLAVIDRTVDAIKLLKKEFGKDFHIHLYTSFDLVDKKKLKKLYQAGLDEIRFHPDLDDDSLWKSIELPSKFNWNVGIEIPAIPCYGGKIKELISFSAKWVDFLNINELEISDTNGNKLSEMGFVCKNRISYAIKGSHEMALKLMDWCSMNHSFLPVHYCTSKLKDDVQMRNRIMLRAKNIAKPYEFIDDEGMIVKGVVKTDKSFVQVLKQRYDISDKLISYDSNKGFVLIAPWVLDDISDELISEQGIKCGVLTEYPTYDRMIVELDWIS